MKFISFVLIALLAICCAENEGEQDKRKMEHGMYTVSIQSADRLGMNLDESLVVIGVGIIQNNSYSL